MAVVIPSAVTAESVSVAAAAVAAGRAAVGYIIIHSSLNTG